MIRLLSAGSMCGWLASLVAQVPSPVAAAFERAGANRAQLEQAVANVAVAERASLFFLLEHMPDADAKALDAAFLLRMVQLSHAARAAVAWGAALDDDLFTRYVLPYAQANEAREDWRSDFQARFLPLVRDCATPGAAAVKLNETIFAALNVHYSTGRSRADQAPSAAIREGKASCTGLSILLADACRACCVPARLVAVRWPHKPGNHTWVEIFDGAAWRFLGADEPDPQGLDRAWFVGDAAQCADADREHRAWAVSFAATGQRFVAGWGRGIELAGIDVSERYRAPAAADDSTTSAPPMAAQDAALAAQLDRFFVADRARQATFEFDRNLDAELRTVEGDARLRALAFAALCRAERRLFSADHAANRVRAGDHQSAFTVKQVGDKPAGGWPLVIAMHGGGGVKPLVNDGQWRHMQVYYKDHPEAGGYLYCALRAPTDEWNGFYTDYVYPLIERLIRQFVVCAEVDPDRVVAIGYSHGGYGAFALGPKLPHRFAAVHASASAPTDGETSPLGLHTLRFSFMVGGRDTAYGRHERCTAFAAQLAALQEAEPGRYPTTFTLVADNGHTGLPDRDLLAQLVPLRRPAPPRWLHWQQTDGVVADHYWLFAPAPQKGQEVKATIEGGRLAVTTKNAPTVEAWLDARLCVPGQELTVVVDGHERRVAPSPSLRTLCSTLQQRGDPWLSASCIVALR